MSLNLRPSDRPHGAQRMLSMTTLVVEALVVLFAALVAHQLVPGHRVAVWTTAIITAVLLVAVGGMARRGGAVVFVIGAVLQIPVLLMGIWVPAMWVIGALFAVLYVYGVLQGHRWDAEKDAVDQRVLAERGEL